MTISIETIFAQSIAKDAAIAAAMPSIIAHGQKMTTMVKEVTDVATGALLEKVEMKVTVSQACNMFDEYAERESGFYHVFKCRAGYTENGRLIEIYEPVDGNRISDEAAEKSANRR